MEAETHIWAENGCFGGLCRKQREQIQYVYHIHIRKNKTSFGTNGH